MEADDAIHPGIPHHEALGESARMWYQGPADRHASGYERALSSRGLVSPDYVRMTIDLPFSHPDYRQLVDLLQSIGIDPDDMQVLRPADKSYAAYVRANRIAAVEARFIADGNESLLYVQKLPKPKPTNPIGVKKRKKR
jgi:hypothetical protein